MKTTYVNGNLLFRKRGRSKMKKETKKLRINVLQLHRSKLPSRMKLRLDLSLFY